MDLILRWMNSGSGTAGGDSVFDLQRSTTEAHSQSTVDEDEGVGWRWRRAWLSAVEAWLPTAAEAWMVTGGEIW